MVANIPSFSPLSFSSDVSTSSGKQTAVVSSDDKASFQSSVQMDSTSATGTVNYAQVKSAVNSLSEAFSNYMGVLGQQPNPISRPPSAEDEQKRQKWLPLECQARSNIMNARKELARILPEYKATLTEYVSAVRNYDNNPVVADRYFNAMSALQNAENRLGVNVVLLGTFNNTMRGLESFSLD